MSYNIKIKVSVETKSPIHLSSGQADVNVDADVVHDKYGLPYFPAKRLKGLLYESAIEVKEMTEETDIKEVSQNTIDELFQHTSTDVQMIAEDLYFPDYEKLKVDLEYLEARYPAYVRKEDVLQEFTSIRYQTAIDKETGTAADGSLRNIRVVDENITFSGIWEIQNAEKEHMTVLALAMKNLNWAGGKRNRGFGKISCKYSVKEIVEVVDIKKDEKTQAEKLDLNQETLVNEVLEKL